jgi:hypothetical protein
MVCPVCFNAKQLDKGSLIGGAELAGSVQLWEWIGDDGRQPSATDIGAAHPSGGEAAPASSRTR